MGQRYWRAIAFLLIASVISRRNDSSPAPGGGVETHRRSSCLNQVSLGPFRLIRDFICGNPDLAA